MKIIKLPAVVIRELDDILAPYITFTDEGRVIDFCGAPHPFQIEVIRWRLAQKLMRCGNLYCLFTAYKLQFLIRESNSLLPTRFIRRRLAPDTLRIPTPAVDPLRPLGGRAPPPMAVFVPIPQKTEMGSCARSDLAVSAY